MKRKYKKDYKDIKHKIILMTLLVFILFLVCLSIILMNYLKTINAQNKITTQLNDEYEQATNIKILNLNNTEIKFNTNNNTLYTSKNGAIERYVAKFITTLPDSIYNLKLPLELNDRYSSAYIEYKKGIMNIYIDNADNKYLNYSLKIKLSKLELVDTFNLKECDIYTINTENSLYIDKFENLNLVTIKNESSYTLKKLNKLMEKNYDTLLNVCTVSNRISNKEYELLKLYNPYTYENYIAYLSNTGNSQFISNLNLTGELNIKKEKEHIS